MMLREQGITVYPEDIVRVFPDPTLGLGGQITIYRAPKIKLSDANKEIYYRTWKSTVREFLAEKQIEIGDKDIVEPGFDAQIKKDLEIRITRVSETNLSEKIYLDFKTIKKEDPNLEKGKSYITKTGQKGIKERIFKVRRENGQEVSRVLLEEKVITQPQAQIIIYGTKKIITVRCAYKDLVSQAASKYNLDPNEICNLMMKESNGHSNSINLAGPYYGLFQYSQGLWKLISSKAGYGGDIFDPYAQIFNTAWALANGYRNHWK